MKSIHGLIGHLVNVWFLLTEAGGSVYKIPKKKTEKGFAKPAFKNNP